MQYITLIFFLNATFMMFYVHKNAKYTLKKQNSNNNNLNYSG